MIKKAIILAAGYGTSFLPATKALPKEMLAIVDKPIIQHLVEECSAAGIEDIMIVTGRGSRAIEEHFDVSFDLQKNLVEKGNYHLLSRVEAVSRLARIAYIRQKEPRGDGDAILQAYAWIGDEPCLVLYGDELIDNANGPSSILQLLQSAKDHPQSTILGLAEIEISHRSKYGIVEVDTEKQIKKIIEKPQNLETQSTHAIAGKFILQPSVLEHLKTTATSRDGRISMTQTLSDLAEKNHSMYACVFTGSRFDVGDKVEYLKASIHFALKDDTMRADLLSFIHHVSDSCKS